MEYIYIFNGSMCCITTTPAIISLATTLMAKARLIIVCAC